MPYKIDDKNWVQYVLILRTCSGQSPGPKLLYKLQTDHHKHSLGERRCYALCQAFTHTRLMAWARVLMIVTKLSRKFTNPLAICIQITSKGGLAQFAFNANQFSVHSM